MGHGESNWRRFVAVLLHPTCLSLFLNDDRGPINPGNFGYISKRRL